MKKRKVIDKRIRVSEPGLDVNADVNVVMSANIGGRGERTVTRNVSRVGKGAPPRRPRRRSDAKPRSTE